MKRDGIVGAILLLLGGCGPNDPNLLLSQDASVARTQDAEPGVDRPQPAAPRPPAEPAPPARAEPTSLPAATSMAPCPTGWQSETSTRTVAHTSCIPWRTGAHLSCADHEAQFPGDQTCSRIGTACAADGWPSDLPQDREVLYVRENGTGNGTKTAPFGSIAEAITHATPDSIIALSTGTFEERVLLPATVTLWGACAEGTVVTFSAIAFYSDGTVTVMGASTAIRNLRIEGAGAGIWMEEDSSSVAVRDVIIGSTAYVGVQLWGEDLSASLSNVVIKDTRAVHDGTFGDGLSIFGNARVTLDRVVVENSLNEGINIFDGAQVEMTDVVVRGTRAQESDHKHGRALNIQDSQVAFNRTILEDNEDVGLFAHGASTAIQLSDVVIRNTRSEEASGSFGDGLFIGGGARLSGERILLDDNRNTGFFLNGPDSEAVLSQLIVLRTGPRETDLGGGYGVFIVNGGTAAITGGAFIGNAVNNVQLFAGSSAELTDLVIRDTQPRYTDRSGGVAMRIEEQSTATVTRALIEQAFFSGISVYHEGTTVRLVDVTIRDIHGDLEDGAAGFGMMVREGAQVETTRLTVERTRCSGVKAIKPKTKLVSHSLFVRGTQHCLDDGESGFGVNASEGAQITLHKAEISSSDKIGVLSNEAGSVITAYDLIVADSREGTQFGHGLQAQLGGKIVLERARVERNSHVGIALLEAELEATDLVVRDNPGKSDGTFGRGLEGVDSRVVLRRALFDNNREAAIVIQYPSSQLIASDLTIRGTRPRRSDGWFGRALILQYGATATVTRALFERNRSIGLQVIHSTTRLTGSDLIIRNTAVQEAHGIFGRAISVEAGAQVTLTRALMADNREVSVAAIDRGSAIHLFDAVITNTGTISCTATGCDLYTAGVGAAAVSDGLLTLERFLISRNALIGVGLSRGGTIDLTDGEVSSNPVGANVDTEDFDVGRLNNNVIYRDNGINLDSRSIQIPQSSALE